MLNLLVFRCLYDILMPLCHLHMYAQHSLLMEESAMQFEPRSMLEDL